MAHRPFLVQAHRAVSDGISSQLAGRSDSGRKAGVRRSAGQVADSAESVRSGVRQGRLGGDRSAGVGNYYFYNKIKAHLLHHRDTGHRYFF